RIYALHLRNESVQYYDGVHWNFTADLQAETDTWYHVAIIVDTPGATEHAWIDGEYIGNRTLRFADGSPVPNDVVFTDFALIGSSAWSTGEPHHFYVDNVRVRRYVPVEPVLTYAGPAACASSGTAARSAPIPPST
ncbi:MAG: LamG domain-containing protein, partial [Methanomicrobiales archaeon]|nr:LamG domain-containing protein [Methanomicrobiales archaeon]